MAMIHENNIITILLPVHNEERWLDRCLKGLISQTHTQFKCIVGFNGTRDKSREIFDSLCSNDGRFVKVDFGEISGKCKTLNSMLDLVETEYTCLIDGDDIWHQEKLSKQLERLGDFDICGTMAFYIDEYDNITYALNLATEDSDIKTGFSKGHNQIVNSSCMVKTELFKEIEGWDEMVEGIEDFDVWLKLYKLGKNFINIPYSLVYHRIHSNSNFNSKPQPMSIEELLKRNKIC